MYSPMNCVAAGVIAPEDFSFLQKVVVDIVGADWFPACADKRQRLAAFVLELYRRGTTDPQELLRVCTAIALERFSDREAAGC